MAKYLSWLKITKTKVNKRKIFQGESALSIEKDVFKHIKPRGTTIYQGRRPELTPSKEYVEGSSSEYDPVVKKEPGQTGGRYYTKTEHEGILEVHQGSPDVPKHSFSGRDQQLNNLVAKEKRHLEFIGSRVVCTMCKKEMSSDVPLKEHLLGKVHRKNSRK